MSIVPASRPSSSLLVSSTAMHNCQPGTENLFLCDRCRKTFALYHLLMHLDGWACLSAMAQAA